MVFSSLPLYHLDPQANWHNQQSNDHHHHHQILIQNQNNIHENGSGGSVHHQHTPPHPTPPPQSQHQGGVACGGSTTGSIKPNSMVDRARQAQLPLPEAGLKCPRCESTNTKFCYFNNYNLSQPRHFCKTCRRYWTRGGSLRNVPVGGGSRRTAKRSKARPGGSASVSVTSGGARSLGTPISSSLGGGGGGGGGGNNSCSTSLFLSHNLPQLPFLPSLHHLGNSNPNNIGLNLLGAGGAELEFPNLLSSFEGLGRMNGMHSFENSSSSSLGNLIGHSLQSKPSDLDPEVINRVSSAKIEDHRGVNLAKEFALVQGNHHMAHQFNWNTASMWSGGGGGGGSSDLSGFASASSDGHHLLG